MSIVLALSDSYSNILAAHQKGAWAFREENLNFNEGRNIKGDFITIYCTEKETPGVHGLHGLGIITEKQIPGKVVEHIWLDRNYYGLIKFKSLSNKFMSYEMIKEIYGKRWNREHFVVGSNKLPPVKLSEEQFKAFMLFMLGNGE